MRLRRLARGLKTAHGGADVRARVNHLQGWMGRARASDTGPSGYDHVDTVREYYDLSTEFMTYGWGESLHFAPLSRYEDLEESKIRHQRLMIDKLDLRQGMTVIDVGCGLGGPLRRVVQESGVRVVGINSSEIQLQSAKSLDAEAGIGHMVDYCACSFMNMSAIADETFDRGYAIESTCHAPDKAAAFAEIYRVLKPGALFWGQEMCITDRFDPGDAQHRAIKANLMLGIALKDIATTFEVNRDLKSAGFQIIEAKDRAVGESSSAIPWYQPMERHLVKLGIGSRGIPVSRKTFLFASRLAETLRVFPKGSTDIAAMLDRTANAYVAGGKAGIFTPLYCFLAVKPL